MKNFWKKYKIQAIIAGYFLFLGIFTYGGIFTVIKNIKNGADEIQKKIIDNEIDKKNLNKIPQLVGDYEIFSSQENNFDVILEKESEIEFIKSLEELAKETGNEISLKLIEEESSQAKDVKEKTKTEEKNKKDIKNNLPYENYIVIQLELRGEYPGLVRFLKKLENMDHFVNVVALDLKKEENQIEEKPGNPFVSSDNSEKEEKEASRKKEILKSLIDLIVYIR
ncbi:MAG: hypothetical protein CO140_01655 [Candidatus Moranbacteria bacterium CG_4_9_14_3_um_filter_40_7]|nr:MAG: hypothetical protein COS71_00140 [Candidatus Moranbacteria bacterium CG06_land_8_20_14_3_00_40_12]PJA87925.1 MAG: hypothetical protein CO140_01655 [Candidatus Moranbacteria bacterium CG_4_9_14_3_um_filter_40_7]